VVTKIDPKFDHRGHLGYEIKDEMQKMDFGVSKLSKNFFDFLKIEELPEDESSPGGKKPIAKSSPNGKRTRAKKKKVMVWNSDDGLDHSEYENDVDSCGVTV